MKKNQDLLSKVCLYENNKNKNLLKKLNVNPLESVI